MSCERPMCWQNNLLSLCSGVVTQLPLGKVVSPPLAPLIELAPSMATIIIRGKRLSAVVVLFAWQCTKELNTLLHVRPNDLLCCCPLVHRFFSKENHPCLNVCLFKAGQQPFCALELQGCISDGGLVCSGYFGIGDHPYHQPLVLSR